MSYIIAGTISTIKDLWFIGDEFVNKMYHALQAIQTENRVVKKRDLFIYEEFNVKCFTKNPLTNVHSVATRLVNALIKALNDHNHLPRLIIVIPNRDM